MTALFAENKPTYMIMTDAEYDAIKPKIATETRVIASRPLLRIRLNELFRRQKAANVVLVTNQIDSDEVK